MRSASSEDGSKSDFRDVPANHWAAPWIGHAAEAGWISGSEGGLFKPDEPVTRAEMAAMLAKAAGIAPSADGDSLRAYADAASIRPWAKTAMEAAVEHGLIRGSDGRLNPDAIGTRAEAAAVLYRWLAMKGDILAA